MKTKPGRVALWCYVVGGLPGGGRATHAGATGGSRQSSCGRLVARNHMLRAWRNGGCGGTRDDYGQDDKAEREFHVWLPLTEKSKQNVGLVTRSW